MSRPSRDRDPSDLAEREDPFHVTRASRIYFLPNLMTAGNLFCGFMAVVECIHARLADSSMDATYLDLTAPDHYRNAVWFIFGAMIFDSLDGRLARLGGRESLFGAEFDSLADVVSFGLAPTLLMFFFILSPTQEFPWFRQVGGFIGFVYLLCAAMRLARFNVITNPVLSRGQKELSSDFIGLPVPAAAATVAATVSFLLRLGESDKSLNRYALTLPFLMLLIAVLMMSTVRFPSGKKIDLQTQTRLRWLVGVVIIIGLIVIFHSIALLGLCLAYILFGLVRHWRRHRALPRTL
ncbi:MAG TPA: CDP-diacylglycerol--serine O-phosphatidyltransferase [Opitutaceae bacterium]|jgi:CDP-diacylglycerol--serine O-phosphatidyltransferase|nr:CDP-diacylglycerol--serine O-phosphatidyltransferase [Opitutaceae bacterium]